MYEASDLAGTAISNEHAHPTKWFTNANAEDNLIAIKKETQLDRHIAVSNYLYADGHVETISEDQIIQWVNQGFNFAKVY
jgi:prepilin-type processing-associated H-X9-DG protein